MGLRSRKSPEFGSVKAGGVKFARTYKTLTVGHRLSYASHTLTDLTPTATLGVAVILPVSLVMMDPRHRVVK